MEQIFYYETIGDYKTIHRHSNEIDSWIIIEAALNAQILKELLFEWGTFRNLYIISLIILYR